MNMEKDKWILNVLNSTDGMVPVLPNADLFLKIQTKIRQQHNVSAKTLWLVAASIAILVILNISIMASASREKTTSIETSLEMTINKSNQLYQ